MDGLKRCETKISCTGSVPSRLKDDDDDDDDWWVQGKSSESVQSTWWRPVTHAQTWASYSAVYRFGSLSEFNSLLLVVSIALR